jgi:hypothetical protein
MATEPSGVKTEFTIVELDCLDSSHQRRLIHLLVWVFGVRRLLRDVSYPNSHDETWPQSIIIKSVPTYTSATEMSSIHSNRRAVCRAIVVGGMNKLELQEDLQRRGVEINEAGRTLFASDKFQTSDISRTIQTVEVSVFDLGYAQGATISRIHEASAASGLALCPLELGPHLRLQYLDQPEGCWGHPLSHHRAPSGSVTIVSKPLTEDHDFPKGFYLRRIKGTLWLRGYCSGPDHIWEPEDRLVFCRPQHEAEDCL